MNLNETQLREKYKVFEGNWIHVMQEMKKDNRIPMTIKQIAERRLNSKQQDWKDNSFESCDAVIYGEKGNFKIVKNSELLKNVTKEQIEDFQYKITKEQYEEIEGKEFGVKDKKLNEDIFKLLLEDLYEPYIKMLGYIPDVYFSDWREYQVCILWFARFGGDRSDVVGGSGYLRLGYRVHGVGVGKEFLDSGE